MSLADTSEPDLFDIVTAPAAVEPGEGTVTVELDAADAAALAALAGKLGLAPASIWRAAWALTLARLAGAARVRVGRGEAVAVVNVPPDGELAAWLVEASAAGAGAAPAEAAAPPQSAWREDGQAPLPGEGGPALCWHARGSAGATARFQLARIDRATVLRLGELLRAAVASVVAPGARLETASPLSAAERTRVVETWNRTAALYRTEATVHGLFREQAAAAPDRVALLWDGGRMTYGELDRR